MLTIEEMIFAVAEECGDPIIEHKRKILRDLLIKDSEERRAIIDAVIELNKQLDNRSYNIIKWG